MPTNLTLPSVAGLAPASLPSYRDERGTLVPVELERVVPFPVARVFWVADVPAGASRGGHAHKECQQFLVCVAGVLTVEVYDGAAERRIALVAGDALHVPPGIFAAERYEEPGTVLMVFCDRPYDPADYLADRTAFRAHRRELEAAGE
ncbi:MAG TPA: FdtA/QdtA family cupin domain-containing protein [Stellaceae bacterium]|nr:FdtA/QdtA family cupin domain-containing protein [Stellaceae bacterium]